MSLSQYFFNYICQDELALPTGHPCVRFINLPILNHHMNRTYKFRIYPSKKQSELLNDHIHLCRLLYNQQLENKIIWYHQKGINLSFQNLNSMILDLRVIYPEFRGVHSQVLQDVNNRLIKAFDKFFKEPNAGYPRFRGKYRYDSITYSQSGFNFISNKHLKVSKIGNIFIKLHRVPKGTIKTFTIKRNPTDKWFAIFSCEVETIQSIHKFPDKQVGIDVGIENFATLSTGTSIPNPRYLVKSENRLKFLQRKHSKRNLGSVKRNKMRLKVARLHERVANQRNDFHHKLSKFLVNNYSLVAIEDLNIKGMVQNHHLAKHINDVAWNSFFLKLGYKGEETGCRVDKRNPRKTSIRCSDCGRDVYKTLSDRIHFCVCGFIEHRDINSSYNILYGSSTLGMRGSNASGVVPIGTAMNEEAYSKTSVLV